MSTSKNRYDEKKFSRGPIASKFETTGEGPVVNGVRVQYSCGAKGVQDVNLTYGNRRKGYGRPQHSWGSLFRVFKYFKEDRWKALFVAIITLVSIGITLLGTFLSAPLVDSLLTPATLAVSGQNLQSYYSSTIAGSAALNQFFYNLVDWDLGGMAAAKEAMKVTGILIIIMVVLYIISFVLSIVQALVMTKLGTVALKRMRNDMFTKMQSLPVAYFDHTPHGDLMSRFTNDVDNISMLFISGLVTMFTDLIMIVGILAFIFVLNWLLAIIAVFIECVAIGIVCFNVHRSVAAFSETQVSMGEFNGFSEETLSGLKVIKCFSKEKDMSDIFKSIDYTHTLDNCVSTYMSSMNIPIVNNLNNFATAAIAIFGTVCVILSKQGHFLEGFAMSIGTLMTFVSFLRMFARPFNDLSNQMTMVQSSLAGAERIFQMIDQKPELSQATKWRAFKAEDGHFYWTDGKVTKPVRGEVRLEHVNFSYLPGQPVLKDISLYAKPGQRIALVGSTGAGKTTITNMLTRFYDIDSGKITIDDIDLKDIDRVSMRHSMTLVLQDTHLFTGTIYDNIRFGRLKATDAECEKAAEIACAEHFIKNLPQGYNTVISGQNASLSQGQKQLLSIARCAVSNPPILILDEATSSVDTRTERLISHGMDNLMRGKTTFVIAHRLSTIRYADCIMVMDHGRIIERGTHDQLIAQKGAYYELWTGKKELA
ncbi:MAG TPA: multidrug ABC transporter ATP-binding protein [Firmicutes bacterium]|nr:multidrug ABC transporter ATP-binding protein [Bacillota bacterium]